VNYKSFEKRLKRLGVDVTMATVRNWAKEGLISSYEPLRSGKKSRGGRPTNWPSKAVEEAAAVWAVNDAAGKRLSPKMIREIRAVAQQVFRSPQANYEWSHDVTLSGPNPESVSPYGYRSLKMKFHENVFDLIYRIADLREGVQRMPGDERLIALLDDEEVVTALDRFIATPRSTDIATLLHRLSDVLFRSPLVFELAKTWVAAVVKARHLAPITRPAKVAFHWRSLPSLEDPRWFQLYKVTLEEPDPFVSVFADFDEDAITPEDERFDEDEIVILVDEIDVRKKVFYAPFDEWKSLTPLEP
jgi:hypothetical protein